MLNHDETKNNKLLILIGEVFEESNGCCLSKAFLFGRNENLHELATTLKVSRTQALFVSIVFALNYDGDAVNIKSLADHFSCSPIKVLEFYEDLEFLFEKRILIRRKSYLALNIKYGNKEFIVNKKLSDAIIKNKPIPETDNFMFHNEIELLERIHELGSNR